jgi:hypothetical protein
MGGTSVGGGGGAGGSSTGFVIFVVTLHPSTNTSSRITTPEIRNRLFIIPP